MGKAAVLSAQRDTVERLDDIESRDLGEQRIAGNLSLRIMASTI